MCPEEVNGKPWSTCKTVGKNAQTSTKPGVGGGNGCASQHIRKGAFVHLHSRTPVCRSMSERPKKMCFSQLGAMFRFINSGDEFK